MLTEWKKLGEESARFGFRHLLKRLYEMPDGKEADFYVVDGGRVACVLALTPENKVILAQQFRPGPEKVLLELPGGGINDEEEPLAAARRETLEETGYGGDFQFIGTSLTGGYSTMIRYNFVATNCRKVQEQQLDEFEFIEVVEMPLEEFRAHLRQGGLTDVATGYQGLEFLKLLS